METPEEMYKHLTTLHCVLYKDANVNDHFTKAIKLLNHYRNQVAVLRKGLELISKMDGEYKLLTNPPQDPRSYHARNVLAATEPNKWSE